MPLNGFFDASGYAMFDNLAVFLSTIRAEGLEPPEIIEPAIIYRFPGAGKGQTNRAGWCLLFNDRQGGCFGDWSSGLSKTWQANKSYFPSKTSRGNFALNVKIVKAKRENRQVEAAKRAKAIWSEAEPAPNHHPYLAKKRIHANRGRFIKGTLILPVCDFSNKLTSLQFIYPNGRKYFLAGGRKKGCYIPISCTSQNPSRIIVCEGWATGCTLSEDEPDAMVLVALDAGNLKAVAIAASHHMPSADLIIAGDDDRLTPGNPGATKARTAAIASGAKLAMPQWPDGAPEHLTDFNDLAIWLAVGDT